ncbi:MAG TPA: tight adherence pilus pseudopilin TadF [Emcibacteraceae bacterium]|nr:tight adherence pilus pseudopilin TadF [Emcibacteraceae bacterium]
MILKSKNSRKISFNPDTCDKDSLNICQDQKGVALIEFAVVTPFITALLLGCIDLTYYLVAHQRISRSAYTMSNLMTQMDKGLTESQVSDMMLAFDQVSKPFNISDNGRATITAIIGEGVDGADATSYSVAWQRCYGPNSSTPSYGAAGSSVDVADIPTNSIVTTSQILVVTEVDYTFEPILGILPLGGHIKYDAYFRPRRGTIENIVADGSAPNSCS